MKSSNKMVEVNEAEYSAILAGFNVAAKVLAIRFFLFLSLIGTFSLALIAIEDKTFASLFVMIAYAFLTTGTLAVLECRGRPNGE